MTKLRDVELPEEIFAVFRQIVRDASDEEILAHVQCRDKSLAKGLRPTPENASKIRERLAKRLEVKKTISKEEARFLAFSNPLRIIDDLSEDVVRAHLSPLCSVLGREQVLSALLIGERSWCHDLANEVLSGEFTLKSLPVDDAKSFAVNTFVSYAPFQAALAQFVKGGDTESDDSDDESENDSPPNPAVDEAKQSKAEEECARLKEKLAQVKKDLKAYKKDAVRAQELDKKLERSEKKRSERKKEAEGLKSELADCQKELELLRAAISTQVDEELDSSLHSWLRSPRELQQEVARKAGEELLERAGHLVEKQEEVDRSAGNRRELSDRLRAINDARLQFITLSRESLNPLPDLAGMIEELDKEAGRLRQLLDRTLDESAFVQNFMAKIGQASSPDAVMEYKGLLERLKEAGVLERGDARRLFEYCDSRMDLAYDKYVPDVKDAAPVMDPFRRLKESIANNREMIWFLDGHNILFGLPELFGTLDAAGKPTEESRYKLSEALVALSKDADNCLIRLYYDGPEHSEYSPAGNVKVIYSGGEGDHRADRVICSDMEYLCSKASSVPFFITTDDRGLRAQATHLSANPLYVEDLYILLRNSEKGKGGSR